MAIPAFIAELFEPVAKVIDELHTSAEERGTLRSNMYMAQARVVAEVLSYETKLAESQASVIIAEAQGSSWAQRNWRPILMLTFGYIVFHNYVLTPLAVAAGFDVPILEIPGGMWALLTTGVGGYVIGRSGEKIARTLTETPLDFSKGSGRKRK